MRETRNTEGMPILSPEGMDPFPWDIILPHEAQAQKNHGGQTLQQLAERGGLNVCEVVAVLEDRSFVIMTEIDAIYRLVEIIRETTRKMQQEGDDG